MFESASWDGITDHTIKTSKNYQITAPTSKLYNQKYALKKITIFLRKLLFFFINKFLM